MKKFALALAAAIASVSLLAVPTFAADYPAVSLFDDFDRPDADRDLTDKTNTDGKTVWWMNRDEGTSIEDGALKMTGETHLWVIDIDKSGLKRDLGLHLNIGGGTLYVDKIFYAGNEKTAAEEAPADFPAKALVDDFNRPADEADNSGGVNSRGLDTWWYNAYDYVIGDGALVIPFDGDAHQHFGMGANVPSEAGYKYLVLRVKGVTGGDYSGLFLNLGAKNPVYFSDMKDPKGMALLPGGKFPNAWSTLVIDLEKSGVFFDQGFHINSDTVGTLYIDEIYYTSADVANELNYVSENPPYITQEAAPGAEKANPTTGQTANPIAAIIAAAAVLSGAASLMARKARRG